MQNSNYRRISLPQRIEAAIRMSQRSQSGETVGQISQDTGIGKTRLYELERDYKQGQALEDKQRPGRKKKVTKRIEQRVIRELTINPFLPSKKVKHSVNAGLDESNMISDRTVRRIAQSKGLTSRRPAFKFLLTPTQKAARLKFAQKYKDSDMRFWGHVIFSDESKIELFPHDRRVRVRRPLHKRFCPKYLARGPKGKGASLMFWGCITYHGQGRLHRIIGVLTGERYCRILQECLPPLVKKQNLRSPVFQEDNAPVHLSKIAQRKKDELGLNLLEWPSYSPDLNPIEGLWSYWKDQVRRRMPSGIKQLERICLQEWEKIPPTIIKGFVTSMPRRIKAVINTRGDHTKY